MKKTNSSESGSFNPRIFAGFLLCSIGAWLAMFSFASTPPSGTLTDVSGPISYTAGPFFQSNQSPLGLGQLDTGPRCDAADPCDTYTLTVTLPNGYAAAHPNAAIKATMFWTDTGTGQSNYDLYIFNGTNPTVDGNHPADHQSVSNSNPEVAIINPVIDGTTQYTFEIVPNQPTGETVQVRIELLPGSGGIFPGFGGADPTAPGVPRYQIFVAPSPDADVGNGEFNIGFNPHTGRIMTMNSGPVWRITPGEIQNPALPECCEGLWENKSSTVANIGLDPILWTDQKTGRTFVSNSTVGANAVYAYTDSDGDATQTAPTGWTPFGIAAPNGGADHETIGSGPYPSPLNLALTTPQNQGEAVYYCSQDIVGPASCYRSDTLGTSYGPSTLAYNGQGTSVPGGTCGGLHGHIHVAPDGTAWLPVDQCHGLQGGVFSTDGGTTWNTFTIPGAISQEQGADPSIAIDADSTIYYAYVNNEPVQAGNPPEGHARAVVGHRVGTIVNWTNYVDLGATHGVVNAAEIEAVGGSSGRAAVGFLGTNVNGDYQANSFPGKWYPFIATTYDGGQTWTTVNATPNDPVQNMTGIWQQGGGAKDRNLLDFNEITIDDKGRVLYGYSDGCVTPACIAGAAPNDFVANMRVARQSGGETLLSSYDGQTDLPGSPANAPKPPCLSGTRDTSASHLTWKTPDNGGSPIANYLIFRGTASGNEIQIGQTGVPKNSFEDTSADPNVAHYFYEIKAVNSSGTPISNFSNEIDLPISAALLETPCSLPGLTILQDGSNDELDMLPSHDVRKLSIGEPFAFASNKIVFTLKMQSLSNPLPAETEWPIKFDAPDGHNYTVQMTTEVADGATAATPLFQVFDSSSLTGGAGAPTADPASNFTPDGTITIVVPRNLIGNPIIGSQLNNFIVRISAGTTLTPDNMPNNVTPAGTYTIVGNAFCAPNTAPIAALSATPTTGDPPLLVTFSPSGTDADSGDTIASYTINFGDGSTPVTQNCTATCPQIQHTYTSNGDFGAQLKVTDSRSKISSNTALVDIGVELPLNDAVSTKTHGAAGPMPIHLINPGGTASEETRGTGTTNNTYTLVYTFDPAYRVDSVASNSSTVNANGSSAGTATPSVGPGANQMTLTLTGIATAQHLAISANGIHVTRLSDNGTATLNSSSLPMDVLVGDVTQNRRVDGNDVSTVQGQVRAAVTSSNFRDDVTANGRIDGNDVSTVQSCVRTSLPQ
jgi:PKD domain